MTTDKAQLIEFDTHIRPDAPVEIFPDFLRAYILAAAEETQTTLDANCMAALSIISAVGASKFYVEDQWSEPVNIYSAVVAGSGERKSTTFKKYAFPILELEKEHANDNKRWITDDVTMERLVGLMKENQESIAILSAEGGIFETAAGRYGNTPNLDVLLKSFLREPIRIDRVNKELLSLDEPCLTIGLFVQPTILQNVPKRFADRGLLGRFIYSFPKSLRGKRNTNPAKMDEHMTRIYSNLIRMIVDFQPEEQKTMLRLDDAASEAFAKFADNFERRLGYGGDLADDAIGSWTERFPGQLLRIASLMHIAEQAELGQLNKESMSSQIPLHIIERVLSRQDYFIEHAKMAFGLAQSDQVLEDAKYLINFFKTEGKLMYKRNEDVWTKTKGRFPKAPMLDRALTILEDREYIRFVTDDKMGRGRKAQLILVHESLVGDQTYNTASVQPPRTTIEESAKQKVESAFLDVKQA